MTGVEKITSKISEDSDMRCAAKIASAQAKADRIVAEAKAAAQEIRDSYCVENAAAFAQISERAAAAADRITRQTELSTKIEAINSVIAASAKQLRELPVNDYFSALIALCGANACEGEGTMLLSAKDIERMPDFFEAQLNEYLPKGSSIKVSKTAAAIPDGFVLVYGDIEINCTFDALIDEKRDELKEIVNSVLFQD